MDRRLLVRWTTTAADDYHGTRRPGSRRLQRGVCGAVVELLLCRGLHVLRGQRGGGLISEAALGGVGGNAASADRSRQLRSRRLQSPLCHATYPPP